MSGSTASTIGSVGELVSVIESWEKKFFDPGVGFPPIRYRGQVDSAWGSNPGILRPDVAKMAQSSELQMTTDMDQQVLIREGTLNKQFMRMGASLFPPGAGL